MWTTDDPQAGRLTLDGHDFRTLELRWLRQQIGFVEQARHLTKVPRAVRSPV